MTNGVTSDMEADNLLGINVVLTSEIGSLRAGYASTEKTLVATLGTPREINEVDRTFTSIGATLDWNNFIGYAEYVEGDTDIDFIPNTSGWYVTAGMSRPVIASIGCCPI